MTTPPPNAAALVTELASLINLPGEQRSARTLERLDQIRWAVGGIDPADRMTAYATAVAAIDPGHLLGPYPDPFAKLTRELYAFETWRLARFRSCSPGPRADVAQRLLAAVDPIALGFLPDERFECAFVRTLLDFGNVTADQFPSFALRAFLRESGADLEAYDAAVEAHRNLWAPSTEATTN